MMMWRRRIGLAGTLAAGLSACLTVSGVGDLEVDDALGSPREGTAIVPDGSAAARPGPDSEDASVSRDAAVAADDATSSPEAGADASTCGDPSYAAKTSCASAAQLSSTIVTCRQFCASRGKCCSTSCKSFGLPAAGLWYAEPLTCDFLADYILTNCDEKIRGKNPGYFQCCCY